MGSGGARPGTGPKRKSPIITMTATERSLVPASPGAAIKMVPPIHLGELAQLIFAELVEQLEREGRADVRYVQHVALTAMRLEQVQRFQAVLETAGDTYETVGAGGSVMYRVRPEVKLLSDAMRQAQSLLGELMLNPVAALRIASGKDDLPGEFDDF